MKPFLSERVQRVKPSATLAVSARANQLKAEGKKIFNLSVGEPDFDTPPHIKEAAIKALHDGFTKYTAVEGILSLRQAIAEKLARDNQFTYTPKEIVVTCGVKQGLYNAMQALLNVGDEVLIPAPYWVSYPDMVLLAEAKPVFIKGDIKQHFKITTAQLKAAITPRTRMFLINSPSNPSGMAYTRLELEALSAVLLEHPQIWVITDDMYEKIWWADEPFCNLLNVCPALKDRTIVFNGFSKTYAMTGWRLGYAAGPQKIIEAMTTIQSQSTSNATSFGQVGAEAALRGPQDFLKVICRTYHERHQFMHDSLKKISGVSVQPSMGTFYSLPNFDAILKKSPTIRDDIQLATYLLEKAGVAVVPGTPFGAPGCLRFSYATNMETLRSAMQATEQTLCEMS